jgi:hypothetical protein
LAKSTVSGGPYPNRPIRVGVAVNGALVLERTFDAGTDVWLGADTSAALFVRQWSGPNTLLISGGVLLHLAPGMRLIMCDEAGGHWVAGTFEELQENGMTWPLQIPVSRLNIRVQEGISVFVEFMD